MLPGAVRYGDVPGVLALLAPRPLWLADEPAAPKVVEAAYKSANAADQLKIVAKSSADAAVDWLIG